MAVFLIMVPFPIKGAGKKTEKSDPGERVKSVNVFLGTSGDHG